MIDSKDMSVVVQGKIDETCTAKCLKSVRGHLPEAEIILSTWKGSVVDGLLFDVLVLNEDPGSAYSLGRKGFNNTNRQIVSTFSGIKESKRKFVLKLRSDCLLMSDVFLKDFHSYQHRNDEFSFFAHRILACTLFTKRFLDFRSKIPTPFHLSDWFQFGRRDDMLLLWNVPLINDMNFFDYNAYRGDCYHGLWITERYCPEQYIFFTSIRKKHDVEFPDMLHWNSRNIAFSEKILANNVILKSPVSLGFTILKEPYSAYIDNYNSFVRNQPLCLYDEKDFELLYESCMDTCR